MKRAKRPKKKPVPKRRPPAAREPKPKPAPMSMYCLECREFVDDYCQDHPGEHSNVLMTEAEARIYRATGKLPIGVTLRRKHAQEQRQGRERRTAQKIARKLGHEVYNPPPVESNPWFSPPALQYVARFNPPRECRTCGCEQRVDPTTKLCSWCRADAAGRPYGSCDECHGARDRDLSCACEPPGEVGRSRRRMGHNPAPSRAQRPRAGTARDISTENPADVYGRWSANPYRFSEPSPNPAATLAELRRQRQALWRKFMKQGGRGVELADLIDELDRKIELKESRSGSASPNPAAAWHPGGGLSVDGGYMPGSGRYHHHRRPRHEFDYGAGRWYGGEWYPGGGHFESNPADAYGRWGTNPADAYGRWSVNPGCRTVDEGQSLECWYTNPHDEDSDEAGDDEPMDCPQCGGPAMSMGSLGSRAWFRCRDCGWEFARVESADMPARGPHARDSSGTGSNPTLTHCGPCSRHQHARCQRGQATLGGDCDCWCQRDRDRPGRHPLTEAAYRQGMAEGEINEGEEVYESNPGGYANPFAPNPPIMENGCYGVHFHGDPPAGLFEAAHGRAARRNPAVFGGLDYGEQPDEITVRGRQVPVTYSKSGRYHRARVADPDEFTQIRTSRARGPRAGMSADSTLDDKGIKFLIGRRAGKKGPRGGQTEITSYMFDATRYTPQNAVRWLEGHKVPQPLLLDVAPVEASSRRLAISGSAPERVRTPLRKVAKKVAARKKREAAVASGKKRAYRTGPTDDRRCTETDTHGRRCKGWTVTGKTICGLHAGGFMKTAGPAKKAGSQRRGKKVG